MNEELKQLVDQAVGVMNDLLMAAREDPDLPQGVWDFICEADWRINSVQDSIYFNPEGPE